jgi:hypothetical protein
MPGQTFPDCLSRKVGGFRASRRAFTGLLWSAALLCVGLALIEGGEAVAQSGRCTGNGIVQQAPYTCTSTRVIDAITFDVTVRVEADGQAVVDVLISPTQPDPVPISLHSYTAISQSPSVFVDGSIPPGSTGAQLVIPQVMCGQLDVKAVHTAPGDVRGHITGPRVTWGQNCTPQSTSTTTSGDTAPTSVAASVAPLQVSTSTRPTALPATGGVGRLWMWAVGALSISAALVVVARRHSSV